MAIAVQFFYNNNYFYFAIGGILWSRLYKMNEIERFLSNNLYM